MTLKVLLIYPDIMTSNRSWPGYYYYGIGYLSSCLKKAGYDVSAFHILHDIRKEELLSNIYRINPQVIGFSATTNQFYYVRNWSSWIKENFDVVTICGGVHPILNPEEVIATNGIDAICVGEGEHALVEVCNRLKEGKENPANIEGMWVKDDARIIRNPKRALIENLDTLPFPDRNIMNYQSLYHERMGVASVMASRGCPYHCSYCCNDALRKMHEKSEKYVRFKSVDYLIEELRQILSAFPFIKGFSFDDDILPLNIGWFREFCKKYISKIGLPFTCNTRPDLMKEEVAKLLREAGCWSVHMGIESGNDYIRNKILNRNITEREIVEAFSMVKNYGMQAHSFNMIGIPGEGMFEMLETIKLNAQTISQPHECQVEIFYPFKKTSVYDYCEKCGLISEKIVTDPYDDTILNWSPQSRRDQVLFIKRHFRQLVRLYSFLMNLHRPLAFVSIRVLAVILSFRISFKAVKVILYYVVPTIRSSFLGKAVKCIHDLLPRFLFLKGE